MRASPGAQSIGASRWAPPSVHVRDVLSALSARKAGSIPGPRATSTFPWCAPSAALCTSHSARDWTGPLSIHPTEPLRLTAIAVTLRLLLMRSLIAASRRSYLISPLGGRR